MKTIICDLLSLGSTLSKELSSLRGVQVVQNSKTVVIDLTKPRSYSKQLRNIFCPHAKEPKLEVTQNFQLGSSRGLTYRFKDGNVPLSGAGITHYENGSINFNVNVVDSFNKVEHISASGMYNPTERFFDWNNCGETLERRFGKTIASIDSSGFNFRACVDNNSALKVINEIKGFFRNVSTAI